MKTEALNDQQLVDEIRQARPAPQNLIDEYYRRCIPIYLDFIGAYWHTGYYLDNNQEITPHDQSRMIRVIAESIDLSARDRVLDVGCGIGSSACYVAQNYRCQVRGLTPVEDQITLAGQFIKRARLEQEVHIDCGHAANMPYPDNSFDVVLFFESPCHFTDRTQFFREAYRILKPGGRLAGEDWLASEHTETINPPNPYIESIRKNWAIPALGTGLSYLQSMRRAGFDATQFSDLRTEMAIEKGFSVTAAQQKELQADIQTCQNPLLKMTLEGLLSLGKALSAGAFTVGRFSAIKPN